MNLINLYQDNLERFARFCPHVVKELPPQENNPLQFCQTDAGELNLKTTIAGKDTFYHSQGGAIKEAQEWLETVVPVEVTVLCVYGIGLGYYYDVLKTWLKSNPRRFLIFIEDDLAVLQRFLETDKAAEILRDTQVIVHHFHTPSENEWGRFRHELSWFWQCYGLSTIRMSSLKYYQKERSDITRLILNQLSLLTMEIQMAYHEVFEIQEINCYNSYANLLYLPESGVGADLFDKFPSIPVVICGAGPSLAKQYALLSQVRDRAFVVGAGTGLNILTRKGIIPHFSVCVDPYDASESRFMTSQAYEMPIFYYNRFNHKAFKLIHGPRLHLSGESGRWFKWFERELGLHLDTTDIKGISTSNTCNIVAGAMGCNPIILTGMDLAYTEDKRYAQGAAAHPTDKPEHHIALDFKSENTIPALDFEGNPVSTRWDWVLEASYYAEYSRVHKDISLINATEGGLRILDVPHLNFKDVVERRLTVSNDLQNWLHCEIQQSYPKAVTSEKVLGLMQRWSRSLEDCGACCQRMFKELEMWTERLAKGEKLPNILEEGVTGEIFKELKNEVVFQEQFVVADKYFNSLANPELMKIKHFPDQYPQHRIDAIYLEMHKGRFKNYSDLVEIHSRTIKECMTQYREWPLVAPSVQPQPQPAVDEIYEVREGMYRIRDPDLEIAFEEEFNPATVSQERLKSKENPAHTFITVKEGVYEGQALLLYDQGAVEGECYYANGLLHGPSTFFSPEGTVVARSWFIRGQRVGKSWQYYANGKLYSVQRYKAGNLHGKQEYYYPHGVLKTELFYKDGALDGVVKLYFPSGKLKREQHFVAGKLHGIEKMWNEDGRLIVEAEFKDNLPFGKSRTWHANGQMAKEITFYDNPTNFDLYLWDERGALTHKHLSLPSDTISDMINKSKELQQSIAALTEKLQKHPEKN